jgi:hypothetical protein
MRIASCVLAAVLAATAAGCTAYVDDGAYYRGHRYAYSPAYGPSYAYAYSYEPAYGYSYSEPTYRHYYSSRWAP